MFDNSAVASDAAHQVHGFTNLKTFTETGGLVITEGDGVYVRDQNGKRYFDAVASMCAVALGFSEKELAKAAYEQMLKLPVYHNIVASSNLPAIALCDKLVEITPAAMSKIFLVNSGSEANDTVVKLVWYYNNALGRPEKKKILSRRGSYHGSTVAAASLTGLDVAHMDFDVPLDRFVAVDGPDMYHEMEPGETEEAYAARLIARLEAVILAEGPETVAAMIVDPLAVSGGVRLSPKGYFVGLQALLCKHDILFVVDEVISGFGRTGNMFGCETFGLEPDIMTVAKGICSAYMPLAAVAISGAVFEAMAEKSDEVGIFFHAFTTGGHPTTSAVALRNIELIEERDIIGHVRAVVPRFLARLHGMGAHPLVGDTRGVGLIGAVELVAEKATRQSFPADVNPRLGTYVKERALEHGMIPRGSGETQNFSPPLIVSEAEIDHLFDIYTRTLDDVAALLRADGLLAA
jgi:4-aminobutyrate--pyruvate transaminase